MISIVCPTCFEPKVTTYHTRSTTRDGHPIVLRTMRCRLCGSKYNTIEVAEVNFSPPTSNSDLDAIAEIKRAFKLREKELKGLLDERDERIRQLEIEILSSATVPPEWDLTETEKTVFLALNKRQPLRRGAIYALLYGNSVSKSPNPKVLDVYVSRIRIKTRKFGVKIRTIWGVGWQLTEGHIDQESPSA
jgi:hypothetical protein